MARQSSARRVLPRLRRLTEDRRREVLERLGLGARRPPPPPRRRTSSRHLRLMLQADPQRRPDDGELPPRGPLVLVSLTASPAPIQREQAACHADPRRANDLAAARGDSPVNALTTLPEVGRPPHRTPSPPEPLQAPLQRAPPGVRDPGRGMPAPG